MGIGWGNDPRTGARKKRKRRKSGAGSPPQERTTDQQTEASSPADHATPPPLDPATAAPAAGDAHLKRRRRPNTDVYAAIDLGTNNCRMLIARPERGGGFRVIDSFSRITRLGEGLTATGRLSRVAQDRTIEALKRCADKMLRRGVTESRKVATEACRRADNGHEFLDRVRSETGITLECISADEEARLALTGCASLLTRERPYALVFDIGGGSTELLWVKLTDSPFPCVEGFATLPLGVVTVAEDCGGGDLSARTYQAVVERVRRLLLPFEQRHNITEQVKRGAVQMLGTSGTVTTLGGIYLGLDRYDRSLVDGITMGFDDITLLSRQLAEMSHRQRADSPCIGPQRADLVLAGCAILEAICSLWPMGRLTVADRGLREGMLMNLMAPSPALLGAKALQGGKAEPLLVSVPPRTGTIKAPS
jgi:exopolyphosphatase/guanosine-5'-triphosphate,3'-diphosphate pyrophosphatase